MENHGEWAQLNGLYPNGLLLKGVASVMRALDPNRWAVAEERIAELIERVQPTLTSEKHRNAVASYVQRLIANCVPCQVFTFGSVPLKTYLPDGDIDLTAFSDEHNLKDNWVNSVLDMLRREEKNEHAEFQVKEIQYIQAEVKIIKCIVDNIVVDISFNQLGGLCTLCFLEEVDFLISQNHLFKRSVILIKAWCYYESRVLGAHHGLISTYALETLVLYIFHVFNNSFAGPLEVLYRFVEFFSKFDWANYCVSLWGPVPICSLPNMAANPPWKDGGELLLDKMFLDACKTAYSVFPGVQDSQEHPFITKYFNVVDPLRTNNNLGRSVSKGNFYRIRSAFSFGAQQLARILECPEENIIAEVNRIFVNTWDRHGKGCRPDAPVLDALHLRQIIATDDRNRRKNKVENSTENLVSQYPHPNKSHRPIEFPMQPGIFPVNHIAETIDEHKDSQYPSERDHEEVSRTQWGQYYTQRKKPTKKQLNEKERLSKAILLQNRGHAKPQFARTSSSPELMSMPSKAGSPQKHNAGIERVKDVPHSRSEYNRRSRGSETENHVVNYITDEPHTREISSQLSHSTVSSQSFVGKPVSSSTEPVVSSGSQPSQRYEGAQNVTNVMSSSGIQNYGGHAQIPMNVASHQYVPIPTFLPGYRPQKYSGKIPLNLMAFQSNWGDVMQYSNGPSGSQEVDHLDDEHDFWNDSNADSMRDIDDESGGFSTASSRLSPASSFNSLKTKASSESSWDGKTSKVKNPVRYAVTKHSNSSMNSAEVVNSPWLDDEGPADHSYDDVNDKSGATSVTSPHGEVHHLPGFGQPHMSYPNSVLPFAPMFVHPGSQQGVNHSHGVPVAFYPAGPMPFVTMVPLSNGHSERGKSGSPGSNDHMEAEKPTFHMSQSSQSSDVAKGGLEHLSHSNSNGSTKTTSGEHSDETGLDIFSSDFWSHWKNLLYGRHCQNSQLPPVLIYSPSVFSPPSHSQGNIPFDSRLPHPENSNIFTHVVPVSTQQPGPTKPAGVSRQYDGEYTKHRNGTGTYFPNPKVLRDHQLSTSKQNQGDSRHDRNEQHWEREGNRNFSSKPRFAGYAQPRYRYDKPNSKVDRSVPSGSQTDRRGDTFRKKSHQLHRNPRDASTSKSIWNVHLDANCPLYQPNSRYSHNEVSQSGDAFQPLVMFYPYPQTIAYGAHVEPMQFGSVGPQHFVGLDEVQELSEYPQGCDLELHNYQGDTGPPSPEYSSPPRFSRDDGD